MWNKFPRLRHLDIRSSSMFDLSIFGKILHRDKDKNKSSLKQIKTLSSSYYDSFYGDDK